MITTAKSNHIPSYVHLYESGELQQRVQKALAGLAKCRLCPWNCEINRLNNEKKVCRIGRYARVASYFPHFGEEDCLRGSRGSGTIFFGWCNLRCVFCQNFDISQNAQGAGEEVSPQRLAAMMLELQQVGCHNINFVTPEHVVAHILEALPLAIAGGLRLPIVYNTSSFDSLESLKAMEGIVDIYMPDFKYWSPDQAQRYLKTPRYPEAARAAIKEMHRQVGDLTFDEEGLAKRGVLLRHLIMPGAIAETRPIMHFLATEISRETYVNIMDQYHPAGKLNPSTPLRIDAEQSRSINAEQYPEINRRITARELTEAFQAARREGLHRFDQRRII